MSTGKNVGLAIIVAIVSAKQDVKVLEAVDETKALLDGMIEMGMTREAADWTDEQKKEWREKQRETIQRLHDAACDWLQTREESDAMLRGEEPKQEGGEGFDFGAVFGRGL